MLPEPIPPEESRAMVRRLIEPVWKVVVEKGNDRTKFETLQALVDADPAGVLEKLESAKFSNKVWEFRIRTAVAEALAGRPTRKKPTSIAESIADPAVARRGVDRRGRCPPGRSAPRKLALLDRAALHARAAPDAVQRLWRIGEAAERLHELGEVEKARPLFAEGLRLANQMTDKKEYRTGLLRRAARPGRPGRGPGHRQGIQGRPPRRLFRVVLGLRMMDQDPAEALWFWREMHGIRNVGIIAVLREAAQGDPARAQRFFDRLS